VYPRIFLVLVCGVGCVLLSRPATGQDKPSAKRELAPEIVAVVNGEKITRAELADELIGILGEEALENLIRRKLVEQEARKFGITLTREELEKGLEAEVKRGIEDYMKARGLKTMREFERYVRERGGSLDAAREQFRRRLRPGVRALLLTNKILRSQIVVTPEEVKAEYQKRYGVTIQAKQIVLSSRQEAEEILEKLKAGADFALLARDHSIDVATRAKGGRMRPLSADSELGKAIADLERGELSDVIKTKYGYHILKVVSKTKPKSADFAKVAEQIREDIIKKRIEEKRADWLVDLVARAEIRRNLR